MDDGTPEADIVYEAYKQVQNFGLRTLVDCIMDNAASSGVAWRAMQELCTYILSKKGREDFMENGGIKAVTSSQKRHSDDLGVQRFSCKLLGLLTVEEKYADPCLAEDAAQTLVNALNGCITDMFVQEWALLAISQICHNKLADDLFKKQDTVANVKASLNLHYPKQDYKLCMNAISALRNLVRRDPDVKLAAVKCAAIGTVVAVMITFKDKPRLQDMSFAFIMYLGQKALVNGLAEHAASNPECAWRVIKQMKFYVITAAGKREFMNLNGVKQLCAAMVNLADLAEVIRYGCSTLSALSMGPGAKDVRRQLAKMGVMEAVVAGMAEHEADIDTQRWGATFLTHMAYDLPNCRQIPEIWITESTPYGAISLIVQAMNRFPLKDRTNMEMNMACCQFLAPLGMHGARNKLLIVEAGGLEAVTRTLKEGIFKRNVCEACCSVLGAICWPRVEVQVRAKACGADVACFQAFSNHSSSGEVGDMLCMLAAYPPPYMGKIKDYDANRDIFVCEVLGATAYLQRGRLDNSNGVVLNDVQVLATRAMHLISMEPAKATKKEIPYTPYGGFDRIFRPTKRIG
jgi:hypothetical protein